MYKINESVKLPREAHLNATPVYTWKLQGSPFDPSANAYRYTLTPNTGTLIINGAQAEDDCKYKCHATNEFWMSVSDLAHPRYAYLQPFASQKPRHTATLRIRLPLKYLFSEYT